MVPLKASRKEGLRGFGGFRLAWVPLNNEFRVLGF